MAGRIRVHPQGLLRVFGSVVQQRGAELEDSRVFRVQLLDRINHDVEMELLRHARLRPCGAG